MTARCALLAVVRKLAAYDGRERFVLRGGLVTAHYIAPEPRPVDDVDLLALYPFDEQRLLADLNALVAVDDGATAQVLGSEVIWQETEFPGLRMQLEVAGQPVQLDVGVGDPLVDGPKVIELAGVEVAACRPETMLAWKLHGLYERGPGRWRPKDLNDVDLLIAHATLDADRVARAVPVAFHSRGDDVQLMQRLRERQFGHSDWSLRKWRRFCEEREHATDDLATVVDRIATYLGEAMPPVTDG